MDLLRIMEHAAGLYTATQQDILNKLNFSEIKAYLPIKTFKSITIRSVNGIS